MHRSMKELSYKTHPYSECPLVHDDLCGECNRYYWEEVHPDLHDNTCDCGIKENNQ